ncbi:MAG TPA: hypothetical protein VG649_25435 [Candidatus Angelobacter sp.]|jgi:hypothetical protein|nr:hypothetical protein [Candidatus Angelobacter sp.]
MSKENARVLGRRGARELTMDEFQQVSGGSGPKTFQITGTPPILDAIPDPTPI